MHGLSTRERAAATVAAVLFTGVTGYVLLEDVIAHGAPLSTSHPLTATAIIGSILGGLWSVRLLRAGQVQVGAMLLLLTVAATVYVGIAAAARNASSLQGRADRIAALDADVREARTSWELTKADAAQECRKVGPQCLRKQQLVDAAWSHVLIQEARREQVGNAASYQHAAATFAALTGYEASRVEQWLTLTMPFVLVLVAELGTICFWHIAIGNGGGPTGGRRETLPPVPEVIEEEPNVIEWKSRFAAKNGRPPKLPELQAAFPDMSRTTLWRRASAA